MPPLRILISRPDRLGDVVLSTPLPREIKKKHPDSFIAVLLRQYTRDIYLNNPYIDEIILLDEENKIKNGFKNLQKLRNYDFTHGFMLLPSKRINLLFALTGIKKRFGVGHKLFQFLTNTKSVYRNKYIPLRHESDYCLDFIRKLDIEPEDVSSEIHLSLEEKNEVKRIKAELAGKKKFLVGINTTSGNSAPNWTEKDYKSLIEMFSGRPEIQLVITDYAPTESFKKNEDLLFINSGKALRTSIMNFAALDVLISASTGPMHICAGLKIATISLFCPLTACSPDLWGPLGNKKVIILPGKEFCSNVCPGDPKKCTFRGDGGISPEIVYMETLKFLNENE